jgi:hypothetical protein
MDGTQPTERTWATRPLAAFMLTTDVGFVLYWTITALHVLPAQALFKDYQDPLMQAWNWSFLSLDLLVSATGLGAFALVRAKREGAAFLAVVSLTATMASGLCAITFWTLRRDFDPVWWAPNLFLAIYPLFFMRRFFSMRPA